MVLIQVENKSFKAIEDPVSVALNGQVTIALDTSLSQSLLGGQGGPEKIQTGFWHDRVLISVPFRVSPTLYRLSYWDPQVEKQTRKSGTDSFIES